MDVLGSVGANTANVFATVGKVAQFTFYGLIGLGVVYIFIYFMKFKHPIYLFIEEGKATRIKKDRGFKNKKTRKFQALKNKDIDFPYPESKYEYNEGRKSVLVAFIKNQSATWLQIKDNENFIPADYDMQHKMVSDFESTWNIVKPKQNFWEQYGQQILWVGSLGIFLVVIILILKRMDAIIQLGNSVSLAQAQAGKQVVNSFPFIIGLMRKNETD